MKMFKYHEYTPPSLCFADGTDAASGGDGGSFDSFIDGIVAKLDQDSSSEGDSGADDGDAGQQDQAASDDAGGDDGAPDAGEDPDQPSAEDEGDGQEPADEDQPPIKPPLSWSKEHKEHWAKLPRATQEYLHSREQQRDAEVRRSQNEAAEARKSIEADKAAFVQERQRYAEQLRAFVPLIENLDPVLAEGQRTDWVKASQEDPAGTQARWHQYQQRREYFANAVRQRDAIESQMMQEHLATEGRKLVEAVTDWHDPDERKAVEKAKAGIDNVRRGVVDKYGFQPDDVKIIRDHRIVLMARDALAYHELKAANEKATAERAAAAKAAEKKLKASAPRLAASPGQSQGNTGTTSRSTNAALRKIGRDPLRSDNERIDAIIAQI